jgi:predicted metalloprotease with PDZ domain
MCLWIALILLAATPVAAAEPKCPLEVGACLHEFGKMRERGRLGIEVETDSAGVKTIRGVTPGGPAERAGVKIGDVLERIEGLDQRRYVAGKAGWKNPPPANVKVRRNGRLESIEVVPEPISDQQFARMIGVHMVEGHLAHAEPSQPDHEH